MDSATRKVKMSRAADTAAQLEMNTGHDFGQLKTRGRKNAPSPKLSSAGQFYLDCHNCGRSIFDDGSGSATSSSCAR